MNEMNFCQLVHRHGGENAPLVDFPISIPKIQRDYAEGRETESVKKKRLAMLADMLDVILGTKEHLSLDFIYGVQYERCFQPLDGQQRLTTLFLLYWLFSRNHDLKDVSGHSLFVYETRKTSEEFCHWLVTKDSCSIISDWNAKVDSVVQSNERNMNLWETHQNENGEIDKIANRLLFPIECVPDLFDYFTRMDDFKWDWHLDPNVRSMIVVVESACCLIKERGVDYRVLSNAEKSANLDKIKFGVLDDLNCDGDALFEKMNARGKSLSNFDLLKSNFEEELEKQNLPQELLDGWRQKMDNDWVDFCWDNSKIPTNPVMSNIVKVEKKLENILIRLAGKSFFKTDINFTQIRNSREVNPGRKLSTDIFSSDCNQVVEDYFKYARYERNLANDDFSKLDFQTIYNDFNNLIYTDGNATEFIWKDASWFLHNNGLKIYAQIDKTLLGLFAEDVLGHDVRVIFYGMMAYLNRVEAKSIMGDAKNGVPQNLNECANFSDWMRFVRNVFLNANKTNQIDNPQLVRNAIAAIDCWLDAFFEMHPARLSQNDVLEFIASYFEDSRKARGQEKDRLEEERIKANLRLGRNSVSIYTREQWEDAILNAENNSYLWGQIIAPLSWSKDDDGNYDLSVFKKYMCKLDDLFSPFYSEIDLKLLQACLSIQDYRINGGGNWGSLGLLNDDRDISWKRHLRNRQGNAYGPVLKKMLDEWLSPAYFDLSRDVFLEKLKEDKVVGIPKTDWRYFICKLTSSELKELFSRRVVDTSERYVNFENNTAYIYKATQNRNNVVRYELVTLYLYELLKRNHISVLEFGSSTVNFEAPLGFVHQGNNYMLKPLNGGHYDILVNHRRNFTNLDVLQLEAELINIGVITGL